uniref:Starch synthase, chloroplastic/amyloplastic n=1 Tax=Physcomitrium patens TaxID=3218 RepID=A0A2K1JD44_PHYPA|nr:hypothetical protein PHYPA_019729 [Physcomitrium patens]
MEVWYFVFTISTVRSLWQYFTGINVWAEELYAQSICRIVTKQVEGRDQNNEMETELASANTLEMAMSKWTQETLASNQLLMGNKVSLSSHYGNCVSAPKRLIPPAAPAIQERQVENLVANFLGSLERPLPEKRPRYHVVHLATEVAPVAKVGGLGDVVTGICRALQSKGHRVEIIIPKYKTLDKSDIKHFTAPMYKSIYANAGLSAKIAFTCHNFEPQGKASMEALMSSGLQFKAPLHQDDFQDNLVADKINILKSGLLHSDFVTTVSPTYAKEVLTPEGGEGLHLTLRGMTKKFYDVVNGIDDKVWNPATDPHLEHHYNADDMMGKEVLKNTLRSRLSMSTEGIDAKRPLVCCVSRLVPQKGGFLLRSAIFHTLNRGGQFILQGTSQIPEIKKAFDELAQQFENHPHVRLVLRCEETLTHNIFAAADMFVIPSIFEPCGLTQMYSMRYGTVPVVRKTGGLADSVFDVDQKSIAEEKRNGLTFTEPTEELSILSSTTITESTYSSIPVNALASALDRALLCYKEQPQWWTNLKQRVMRIDMSWDAAPIDQYVKLYEHTVEDGHPPASLSAGPRPALPACKLHTTEYRRNSS